MAPDLNAVAEEYDTVDLVVIDASVEPEVAAQLRVMGTPTLIGVRGGEELGRFTGRRSRSELRDLFSAVAAGDTDTVPRFGRGDRLVWSVAGVSLAAAGLAMGPAWPFVVVGAVVAGYANMPRR